MIDNWNYAGQHSHFLRPSSSSGSGSSSSQSSHLSILTTTSSISSALSDAPHDGLPSPPPSSNGSKTNAFFSSPFAAALDLHPPPPLTRSPSLASSASASSSRLRDSEADDTDTTPRLVSAPAPSSVRSLNDSFFASSSESRPTPPPSLRSFPRTSAPTTPETSPPNSPPPSARSKIAPISRLLPSRVRYTNIDGLPSRESSLGGPSLPYPYPINHRRDFVELDVNEYHKSTSPEQTTSEDFSLRHQPSANPRFKQNALNVFIPHIETGSYPTPIALSSSQVVTPSPGPAPALHSGDVVAETSSEDTPREGGEALKLQLVRTLGQGAFSSVWLARDVSGRIGRLEVVRKSSLKRSKSLNRKGSGILKRKGTSKGSLRRKIEGAMPQVKAEGDLEDVERLGSEESVSAWFRERTTSEEDRERNPSGDERKEGRLVALKMTDRSICDRDDRTRVSFVREVEVLKHISHPSIVSFIHAFSTPAHHILVLEHIGGGELFDLVSSPESHSRLDEPVLRRIFGELCRAAGWMHAVGLVHRDIKLENILLTRSAFSPPSSAPLIKLTDFGLSRFIDPAAPLLTTRCGSESYAAPELVTGRPYDGRESDAWACGVVLYALITRRLPFDAMDPAVHEEGMRHEEKHRPPNGRVRGPRKDEKTERKALLMRIAKGEYSWPPLPENEDIPYRGAALVRSEGAQRVAGKLLVRDPRKRSRMMDLWEDDWMRGDGAPSVPLLPEGASFQRHERSATEDSEDSLEGEVGVEAWEEAVDEDSSEWDFDEDDGEDDDDDGVLVDEHDIGPGSVARQEH